MQHRVQKTGKAAFWSRRWIQAMIWGSWCRVGLFYFLPLLSTLKKWNMDIRYFVEQWDHKPGQKDLSKKKMRWRAAGNLQLDKFEQFSKPRERNMKWEQYDNGLFQKKSTPPDGWQDFFTPPPPPGFPGPQFDLQLPKPRTNFMKRSFSYRGAIDRFHRHAINTAQKINWKPPSGRSQENEMFRQITQKLWATKIWNLDKLFIY